MPPPPQMSMQVPVPDVPWRSREHKACSVVLTVMTHHVFPLHVSGNTLTTASSSSFQCTELLFHVSSEMGRALLGLEPSFPGSTLWEHVVKLFNSEQLVFDETNLQNLFIIRDISVFMLSHVLVCFQALPWFPRNCWRKEVVQGGWWWCFQTIYSCGGTSWVMTVNVHLFKRDLWERKKTCPWKTVWRSSLPALRFPCLKLIYLLHHIHFQLVHFTFLTALHCQANKAD